MTHNSKPSELWILGLLVLFYGILVFRIIGTRNYWPKNDSAAFISGGVALHQGLGFRDITGPVGTPEQVWARIPTWLKGDSNVLKSPDWPYYCVTAPLIPFLLAPLIGLGKGSLLFLQILPIFFGAISLGILFYWRREFFGKEWIWICLLSIGSIMTLYGTRIQSEIFHLPFFLGAVGILMEIDKSREISLANLFRLTIVVFLGGMMHNRIIFLAGGAAIWLVWKAPGTRKRRLMAGSVFTICTIGTIVWYFVSVLDQPIFSLENPYFAKYRAPYGYAYVWDMDFFSTYFWRGFTSGLDVWDCVLFLREGIFCKPLINALLCFTLPLILLWRLPKLIGYRNGAMTIPVLAYFGGCLFSPWSEPRFFVPIAPFLIYFLFGSFCLPSDTIPPDQGIECPNHRKKYLFLSILIIQLMTWLSYSPEKDNYSAEYYREFEFQFLVATTLPENSVVLKLLDSFSFSLLSGLPTVSLTAMEWKNSSAKNFFEANGKGFIITDPISTFTFIPQIYLPKEIARWVPSIEVATRTIGGKKVQIGCLNFQSPVQFNEEIGEVFWNKGRIHPRWLETRPEHRQRFWNAGFNPL